MKRHASAPSVQHRAITPAGEVVHWETMSASEIWSPFASPPLASHTGPLLFETRLMPGGQWRPALVVLEVGSHPQIVAVREMW